MRLLQSRIARLAGTVGGVAVVVGASAAFASGAFAAGKPPVHKQPGRGSVQRWPISIFSHAATVRAHSANVNTASAPQGAIRAAVSEVDGVTHELYAWHKTPEQDCLVDVEVGGGVTVGCSPLAAAESEGLSWTGTASAALGASGGVGVVAMVPNGVSAIEVVAANGATNVVHVVNNVADYTGQTGVKEYRYTMPNGRVVSQGTESFVKQDESRVVQPH